MNKWIQYSIDYANQRSYLDDLFRIYPTIPDGIRNIEELVWCNVEDAFNSRDNERLIRELLQLDLFPIKDSYIAYLRRDTSSISRNPKTINRICGRLYDLGLNRLYEKASEPKETNRQIGPMFNAWLCKGAIGIMPTSFSEFVATKDDAILDASDDMKMEFARNYLGYRRKKGLDLLARFNGKYVIGEAKFLTDFGGHQNAQFSDAISTIEQKNITAIKVAILDGVLYIKGGNKLHQLITNEYSNYNIVSALLLRDFLYQI